MTEFDLGLYRRLVESSPEGVVLIDAQGADHPVIYVNPAFEALTGYSAAELIGRNLRLLQADDREQDGRHRLRDALSRGETCRVLLRNYRKDGTLFWNEMTVLPLRHPDGCVTHFAGHHRAAGERLRIAPRVAKDTLSGAHQPTAMAIRDDRLTGLFTLAYLEELLKSDWAGAHREAASIAGGSLIAFAPGLTQDQAMQVGHLMAERVRDMRIHHPRSAVLRYISISVGVCAAVPGASDSPATLLEKAQQQ